MREVVCFNVGETYPLCGTLKSMAASQAGDASMYQLFQFCIRACLLGPAVDGVDRSLIVHDGEQLKEQ